MSTSPSQSISLSLPPLSPSVARSLVAAGATLVLLDFPVGQQLGLDYLSFTTGERFKGIKMIPPGPHLLHYTTETTTTAVTSTPANDVSFPPSAVSSCCWMWLETGQISIHRWSASETRFQPLQDKEEESRYTLGVQQHSLDVYLGPYPLHHWQRWNQLAEGINQPVIERIEEKRNKSFDMYSTSKYTLQDKHIHTEYTPMKTEEQERKMNKDTGDASQRHRGALSSSPSMYIAVPDIVIPPNASPAHITALHMDRTHQLTALLHSLQSVYSSCQPIISLMAEFRHSFLSFFIAEQIEAFNHWKQLLLLLPQCHAAFTDPGCQPLFTSLFTTLTAQVADIPQDFFIDPLSQDNFIEHAINSLLLMVTENDNSLLPQRLLTCAKQLTSVLQRRFGWKQPTPNAETASNDEYAPIIVEDSRQGHEDTQ